MKRYLILLIALPLIGCGVDRPQEQLARCVYDAQTSYPTATWLLGDARQNYVWLCMAAHGYTLNRAQNACAEKSSPVADAALYAQCYEPRARLSSMVNRFENTFRR